MAKPPDKPKKPKDPARPTRAKAAREPLRPIAPALEKLLNPGIEKGTAGPGSQTGLTPPPDNSWDRRADFAKAHTARKSVSTPLASPPPQAGREQTEPAAPTSQPPGFSEAPQAKYINDAELREASPELARALGLDDDTVSFPEPQFARPKRERRPMERGDIQSMGVAATAESLDKLLREGRAEFRDATIWTPHRPPRPEKSEGGFRLRHQVGVRAARATSRRRSRSWSKACSATTAARCCSASPARARPTPWPR